MSIALEACGGDAELVDDDIKDRSSVDGDDTVCPGAASGEDLLGTRVGDGPRGTGAVAVSIPSRELFERVPCDSFLLVTVPVTRDKKEKKPCPEVAGDAGPTFSFRSSGGPSIPSIVAKDTNPGLSEFASRPGLEEAPLLCPEDIVVARSREGLPQHASNRA